MPIFFLIGKSIDKAFFRVFPNKLFVRGAPELPLLHTLCTYTFTRRVVPPERTIRYGQVGGTDLRFVITLEH